MLETASLGIFSRLDGTKRGKVLLVDGLNSRDYMFTYIGIFKA